MRAELRFAAMGTQARILVVDGPDDLPARLARRLSELEQRWSRFIPTSEVSRLNRADGSPVPVSPDTRRLLSCAIDGWEITYGLFDPTVLGDVERAGYDRTFEELRDRDRPSPDARRSWLVRGASGIEIGADTGLARLPAGVGFDPGGIGKGLAADLLVEEALAAGAAGVLIDLGGDIRVAGQPPTPDAGWTIDIEDPFAGLPLGAVGLGEGAVATTSRLRRRWSIDGQPRHHLIDPRRGEPTEGDVAAVTVVAALGWQAEVLAKAAFVGGPVQGLGLVDQIGGAALLIDSAGRTTESAAWSSYGRPMPDAADEPPIATELSRDHEVA
jgi:thiamine biosynthesis lipoprotein